MRRRQRKVIVAPRRRQLINTTIAERTRRNCRKISNAAPPVLLALQLWKRRRRSPTVPKANDHISDFLKLLKVARCDLLFRRRATRCLRRAGSRAFVRELKRKFNRRFYEIPVNSYCGCSTGQLGNSDFVVCLLRWRCLLQG